MATCMESMAKTTSFITPGGLPYMLRNPPGASPGWLAPGLVTESGVSPDVENPCI